MATAQYRSTYGKVTNSAVLTSNPGDNTVTP